MKIQDHDLSISQVRLVRAAPADMATGLLGWVSLVLGDLLRLDGLTLRRTSNGLLTLSFPARRDASGRQHAIVRPIDDAVRREIEEAVFAALGIEQETQR